MSGCGYPRNASGHARVHAAHDALGDAVEDADLDVGESEAPYADVGRTNSRTGIRNAVGLLHQATKANDHSH